MMKAHKALVLMLALLLQACADKPPAPERAKVTVPVAWYGDGDPAEDAPALEIDWWEKFESAELLQLLDDAQKGNADLRIALERVRQADITVNSSSGAWWPTINLSAGSTRATKYVRDKDPATTDATTGSLALSYELDLWGRIADGVQAGEESFKASQFDWQTARMSMMSSVATQYFTWLSLSERITFAQENLQATQKTLDIVEARRRNGVATANDVMTRRGYVLTQRTNLLALQRQRRQTAAAVAVLLGRTPQGFKPDGDSNDFELLKVPELEPGLPSALLTRRPDLASAEARLRAADANVSAARKAFLPTLTLTGSTAAATPLLFSTIDPTRTVSLGVSLVENIFRGGRDWYALKLTQSQRLVLVETYGQAVRNALREVDDALGAALQAQQQELLQRVQVKQAETELNLADARYQAGSGDLMGVLEMQRSLLTAEDTLNQQVLARLTASLTLYKALGGAWAEAPQLSDASDQDR